MECNDDRLGGRKATKQGREIDKMLDFVNVDDVGSGYFGTNVSQQVGARISQPPHNLPVRDSRSLFLVIYPRSTQNSRSPTKETGIAQIKCHIGVVRVFVAHEHS